MNCVDDDINADGDEQIRRDVMPVTLKRPTNARMLQQEKPKGTPPEHQNQIDSRDGELCKKVGVGKKRRIENDGVGAVGNIGEGNGENL